LLKILLSKTSIPKLFAKQLGWQGALSRLFICHTNTGSMSTSRWLSSSASGQRLQQLVLPVTSEFNGGLTKRQRSVSSTSLSLSHDDDGLDDDSAFNSLPSSKLQFDTFLADPYQHSVADEDEDLDILQAMRTSESCTFSEGMYHYYKSCVAHKFKQAQVRGTSIGTLET